MPAAQLEEPLAVEGALCQSSWLRLCGESLIFLGQEILEN